MIRFTMALCEKSGQFLFQVLPDRFPYDRVTKIEMLLWDKYYTDKEDHKEIKR